ADDADSELALTPAEAADWLHQQLGGRKRKSAAIRKLMCTGLGGVVLGSFRYGRELRTTRADLKRFVQEIRTATEGGGHGSSTWTEPEDLAARQSPIQPPRSPPPGRGSG